MIGALGAHLFLDLEAITIATAAQTSTFANDWAQAVVGAGYHAGCYVGFDVPLTGQELYGLPQFNTYWSAVGTLQVPNRGYALKQAPSIKIAGVGFDSDVVTPDHEGQTPCWMIRGG